MVAVIIGNSPTTLQLLAYDVPSTESEIYLLILSLVFLIIG